MKVFAIGDIHGRIEALKQCLERSKFDKKEDTLIILGDVADGGYNTYEVIEELLTLSNWIYIVGNHDEWFMNHIDSGWAESIWLNQGGKNTIDSYKMRKKYPNYPKEHIEFFNSGRHYYVYGDMVFVHGGFNPRVTLDKQEKETLLWDRKLIETARKKPIYKNIKQPIKKDVVWGKVFVGHTTTESYKSLEPIKFNNLIMLDTGAGWTGKLTIMDVETEEFWQSDIQKPARGHNV